MLDLDALLTPAIDPEHARPAEKRDQITVPYTDFNGLNRQRRIKRSQSAYLIGGGGAAGGRDCQAGDGAGQQ